MLHTCSGLIAPHRSTGECRAPSVVHHQSHDDVVYACKGWPQQSQMIRGSKRRFARDLQVRFATCRPPLAACWSCLLLLRIHPPVGRSLASGFPDVLGMGMARNLRLSSSIVQPDLEACNPARFRPRPILPAPSSPRRDGAGGHEAAIKRHSGPLRHVSRPSPPPRFRTGCIHLSPRSACASRDPQEQLLAAQHCGTRRICFWRSQDARACPGFRCVQVDQQLGPSLFFSL